MTIGHPLRDKILSRLQQGDEFAIVAVALHEFLFGIASIPRPLTNQQEWEFPEEANSVAKQIGHAAGVT
jgi:hypothetical protein